MSGIANVGNGLPLVQTRDQPEDMADHFSANGEAPVGSQQTMAAITEIARNNESGQRNAKDEQKVARMTQDVNASLSSVTSLRFSVDKELEELVIRVVDKDSQEVIRQIPTDKMLDLARRMRDLKGLLVDKEA